MEKLEVVIDKNVAKEHLAPLFRNAIFCFIAALVIAGLYVLFSILWNNWADVLNIILLVAGAFILVAGFIFVYMYFSNIKKIGNASNKIIYEFTDDYVNFATYKEDALLQKSSIPCSEFIGYKETKNYIFLGLNNNNFLVVKKCDFIYSFLKDHNLTKIKAISAKRK